MATAAIPKKVNPKGTGSINLPPLLTGPQIKMDFTNCSISTILRTTPTSRVDNLKKICDILKITYNPNCSKIDLQTLMENSVRDNNGLEVKMRDIATKIHNEAGKKHNGDESLAGKGSNGDEAAATLRKQTVEMLKYVCKTLSLEEK